MKYDQYRSPDPVKTKYLMFGKRAVRILAGIALMSGMLWYAGGLLILGEILAFTEKV